MKSALHCPCGRVVDMTNNPPSEIVWCSTVCRDVWFAKLPPDEAAKWRSIGDLTLAQRAELDALLGNGGKA